MDSPDLTALQNRDSDAWDSAYDWLHPVAFAVTQRKLATILPDQIEDVAIETLEVLVDKVEGLRSAEELKPLTAVIAHNLAVTRLRQHFAQIRGSGKTDSLDAKTEEGQPVVEPVAPESPLNTLDQVELRGLLTRLLAELKPEVREMISGFHLDRLTYRQLADKHERPIQSVGVMLKRGLETIRRTAERYPVVLKELQTFVRST